MRIANYGLQISGVSYGPEVTQLLGGQGGRVLAVLSNAIYIESYEGYVAAIVGDSAVDGPLSLRVHDLSSVLNVLQTKQDVTFDITTRTITFGDHACVNLGYAQEWTARFPIHIGQPAAREQAAYALARAIFASTQTQKSEPCEDTGLALLVPPCYSDSSEGSLSEAAFWIRRFFALLRIAKASGRSNNQHSTVSSLLLARAAEGIGQFVEAVRVKDGRLAGHALTRLIGLGPGLTPSGDDLVAGIIAALVWQANLGVVDKELAQRVVTQTRATSGLTNRISARLLHYAGEGALYAPAMELGAALLAGEVRGVTAPALQLFKIGNTSGADLAVGLLVGCIVGLLAPIEAAQ